MGCIPASAGACIPRPDALQRTVVARMVIVCHTVPPAAPKRDHHGHLLEPALELSLPEPWTGHRDPDTGRTFYYNKVTKDATWREPQALYVCPWTWYSQSRGRHIGHKVRTGPFTTTGTLGSPRGSIRSRHSARMKKVEVEVEPDDVESSYPGKPLVLTEETRLSVY